MIYLDHAATSPLRPEVREAMEPWWGLPANPASVHRAGQRAAAAIEAAREPVAALVGGVAEGVVFTSGATEANHLAILGAAARHGRPGRWVVSPIEHPCVLAAADRLERAGWTIDRLQVDASGRCRVEALPEDTVGVSLMAANHETGVLQPVAEMIAEAQRVGAFVHVDATQAVGKVEIPALAQADAVAVSGHKLGGPPGIGALILGDGEPFPPWLAGGAQERGRRAGTVPTALVVGLGAVSAMVLDERGVKAKMLRQLMQIPAAAFERAGAVRVVVAPESPEVPPEGDAQRGHLGSVIPGHSLWVFPGLRGAQMVQALDVRGLCVSSGAACASGSLEASPVLTAMRHPHPDSGVRISLGWSSSAADVEALASVIEEVAAGVREAAAFGDWG